MLTPVTHDLLDESGIHLRGGVFLEEDDLLDVISLADFVEDHTYPGHYYVGMSDWEVIRKGFPGKNQYREPTGSVSSLHAALLSDGRWLVWSSKTEDTPAYFEVRFPKPSP